MDGQYLRSVSSINSMNYVQLNKKELYTTAVGGTEIQRRRRDNYMLIVKKTPPWLAHFT